MPYIRPISDLRNSANEISDLCKSTREPVYITKNGTGDMVIMSMEMYERREAQLELYAKLAEAEAEAMSGKTGVDFDEFAKKLRRKVHGTV
ncbi:MAG: type II toxin-antitoxin system Phd/YefM family antitoxin [Firmicutes bacterium]|nr:type II toxin-antitoxin system Phd/YefM family antitoxin [Dethiobacter sp.]MBS3897500.1 type II toxin-antitoxin system Phd/YefM family antitoxin [Dethiobacter sp.]MCL4462644.1 type II toxin-antitoxin system Phd/YefM family antitoxin [Bacillota bacterium]MCL5994096.1 type II toxin-antitoxin system Phd/YefM family antitoxin [Bacillota bacterium]